MVAVDALRAEQVGSLLRPAQLQQAWGQVFAGQLDRDALTGIEDRAIVAALEGQRSTGIDVYTDGELRRAVYMTGLVDALDGITPGQGPKLHWKADPGREVPREMREFALAAVTGRLRPKGRIAAREASFMREHSPGPFKVTLPSPAHFTSSGFKQGITDRFYASRAELADDLASILATEAGSLAADGVGYIQVDSPTYSIWFDPDSLAETRSSGVDTDGLLDQMIDADNTILDAAKAGGAVTAVHICRGNGSGAWLSTGSYEPVAEQLFNDLHADRLLLEYDTDRAGGFEPLRLVPADKTVVLGLVNTKWADLEPRDGLLRRIDEAARLVPLDRLAISPQCGFASNFLGNPLTEDEQWRKLELVASVARQVWG